MTDRPPMPKATVATSAAFRVGVKGMRYTEHPDPSFDIPVATDNSPGPNERHFETIERLPGLSDPEAAYETGRALHDRPHPRQPGFAGRARPTFLVPARQRRDDLRYARRASTLGR
jgi:hypothetical protein